MLPNGKAVAMGDGTISDTTGMVFEDDGLGGFWKSAEEPPPPHPWFEAIRNARPPRRRRAVATRSSRVTTARRTKRHKSSTRSTAGSSAGSDLSGDSSSPGWLSARRPRLERKALRREGVARAVPTGTSVVGGRA